MKNLTPAKLIVMMMVAMGLLVALYVGKQLLAKEPPPRRTASRTVPMLVGDLDVGTVISDHHLGMGPWPANDITGDVLLGETAIMGRVVKRAMKAAEPIHGSDLYPMNELPPLTVSDGYRATTIHLTDNAAVMNGLLRPGDHVDIEFTPTNRVISDPRYQEIGAMSIMLFKAVRILAINRAFVQVDLDASGNNVTLEVAEKDVALLRLADENGDLHLSYTPDTNGLVTVEVANPDRPTLEELLQLPPVPEEPVPPQPNVFRSWIYNGAGGGRVQTFLNGKPTGNSYGSGGNYGTSGNYGRPGFLGSNPGTNSGVAPGVNGYPNGYNPGVVNPGLAPGAIPYNGGVPGYGPQTNATPLGAPSTQGLGTPNSGFSGATRRTASAR